MEFKIKIPPMYVRAGRHFFQMRHIIHSERTGPLYMETRKLSNGKWKCIVDVGIVNGKRKRKSFQADTKKEAILKAYAYMDDNPTFVEAKTIEQAVSNYIKERENVCSPSTIRGYMQIYREWIHNKPIGNLDVSRASKDDMQRFVNMIALNHSPKTVRSVYNLVRSSMIQAGSNLKFDITLPAKQPVKRNIPTDSDIQLLLENADEELRIAILLSAFGTLRRGECCALCYEDISGNTIHVHSDIVHGADNKWHVKSMPKNASSDRFIPMPEFVIKEIGKGSGRIIKSDPNVLGLKFIRLKKKLNLDFRFHDLRHYAASLMHALGVPDQYIMERGGWSSDGVLKSVYRNVLNDKQDEFTKMTNDYFSKKFSI